MQYIYAAKPNYNSETHELYPTYNLENGIFSVGWDVQPKPDEDGYTPTSDEQPQGAPTLRERVEALESASDDIILMMADLIGGGE